MIKRRILIDGKEVESESGQTFKVFNPATLEAFEEVPKCTEGDVEKAVQSAKRASKAWADVPLLKKMELMYKAAEILDERAEDYARLITNEMGKTIQESRGETPYVSNHFRIFAEEAKRLRGQTFPNNYSEDNNLRIYVRREPIGVVAIIGPWNWPFDIPLLGAAAALGAGNSVVLKPSSITPGCGIEIAKVVRDAGFPDGTLNVLTGPGSTVGKALVGHPDVGAVGFTGSYEVGKKIVASAGVKKVVLELGDTGPIVVLEDANIDAAVDAAMFGVYHQAGQNCTSCERLIILQRVHEEFVEKLLDKVKKIKVGDPSKEETDMGPVASEEQAQIIDRHIKDAVDKGARLLAGGKRKDLFYEATVLDNVTQDMIIAREETFGPVATIIKVKNKEEALEIANSNPYGLQGAVFTSNLRDAIEMSEKMKFGAVIVNDTTNHWDQLSPFGGVKGSGVGRECSEFGIHEYTDIKKTVINIANVRM